MTKDVASHTLRLNLNVFLVCNSVTSQSILRLQQVLECDGEQDLWALINHWEMEWSGDLLIRVCRKVKQVCYDKNVSRPFCEALFNFSPKLLGELAILVSKLCLPRSCLYKVRDNGE